MPLIYALSSIFESLIRCDTFGSVYNGLTHFYNGFCGNDIDRKDPAKAEYGKQWYSDKLTKALNLCDTWGGQQVVAIKEIVLDLEIQYTPEQR